MNPHSMEQLQGEKKSSIFPLDHVHLSALRQRKMFVKGAHNNARQSNVVTKNLKKKKIYTNNMTTKQKQLK